MSPRPPGRRYRHRAESRARRRQPAPPVSLSLLQQHRTPVRPTTAQARSTSVFEDTYRDPEVGPAKGSVATTLAYLHLDRVVVVIGADADDLAGRTGPGGDRGGDSAGRPAGSRATLVVDQSVGSPIGVHHEDQVVVVSRQDPLGGGRRGLRRAAGRALVEHHHGPSQPASVGAHRWEPRGGGDSPGGLDDGRLAGIDVGRPPCPLHREKHKAYGRDISRGLGGRGTPDITRSEYLNASAQSGTRPTARIRRYCSAMIRTDDGRWAEAGTLAGHLQRGRGAGNLGVEQADPGGRHRRSKGPLGRSLRPAPPPAWRSQFHRLRHLSVPRRHRGPVVRALALSTASLAALGGCASAASNSVPTAPTTWPRETPTSVAGSAVVLQDYSGPQEYEVWPGTVMTLRFPLGPGSGPAMSSDPRVVRVVSQGHGSPTLLAVNPGRAFVTATVPTEPVCDQCAKVAEPAPLMLYIEVAPR